MTDKQKAAVFYSMLIAFVLVWIFAGFGWAIGSLAALAAVWIGIVAWTAFRSHRTGMK